MGLQHGTGNHIADFLRQGVLYCLGLDAAGSDGNDAFALHHLVNGHGNCLGGNFVDGSEPALAYLLHSAALIKINNYVSLFGIKVRGRIVEGDMCVLADADDTHINGSLSQLCGKLGDIGGNVALAVDKVGSLQVYLGEFISVIRDINLKLNKTN